MSDTVQQIKDRLSIVDVVSQYVKLERSGTSLRARCPFHAEKTPSFFVSPERGTFHCFGCNVGGDIFSFVEQIEGLDFKGTLKVLAEKAGVPLVYSRSDKREKDERDRLFELMEVATIFYASRLNNEVEQYLHERGLNNATIKVFRLGFGGNGWTDLFDHLKAKKFSEKEILDAGVGKKTEHGLVNDKFRNRIMFPISDSAGRVVGFSGRIFGEDASPEAPKYLNSPETPLFHKSRILYGLDKAKLPMRKHNCAVLVEGQMDLLASHQAGWGNTVAVSGTAFTGEHALIIRRLTDNLVIALDPDEAGIKAAGRAARAALQNGLNVKVAQLPRGLDPADLILKEGKEAWSRSLREAKDIVTFLLDVLQERSRGIDWFRRNVEGAVLPYVADVQSPIAREQYLREIAGRLDVSIQAVAEALEKIPHAPEIIPRTESRDAGRSAAGEAVDRAGNAYSILLWQKVLPKPSLDLDTYERELEEALGADTLERLRTLPEQEQERLRFLAEWMYGRSTALQAETRALLNVLLKERLSRQLMEATRALKEAENRGDEEETAVHMSVCNVLTRRIARLHEVM
ncbi:DNA primase [Candidatus Kaiserbacteria bacterium]|nr:DNA primase [Candidatus Kaiserbacteria bacterium]